MRIFDAKFRTPPPLKATITRPRLFKRLNEAADCKLFVVTAPAGYGKTTLVSSWIGCDASAASAAPLCPSAQACHAWLSLDERDNELGAFVAHLVGAIGYALPGVRFATADLLQLPVYPPVMDIAQSLIADLARLPHDLTLVLDDYHVIHEPLIHYLVEMLVAYSPEHFRLMILSRHDPPLPVARLYLQGRARQLRANDLRFLPREAEEFLRGALPAEVPAETMAAITEQAGGWIAQLRLAALLLQQQPDQRPESIQNLALDYLVEELIASEPPEARAFLLATSILERFCAPLARAVLQPLPAERSAEMPGLFGAARGNAEEVFNYVIEAGLLATEIDSRRMWYRYPDLFRQLLYQRLQLDYPAAIDLLRRRGFEWLRAHGFVEEALAQAQALGDEKSIADLLEAHVLGAIQAYQWQTAQRWLDMLPAPIIRDRPPLLLAHSYILLNLGSVERVRAAIGWAEHSLRDVRHADLSRQERLWLGTLELMRAEYFPRVNQLDESLVATRRALELLPSDCHFERAFATVRLQCLLAYEGKFAEGRVILRNLLRESIEERAPWVTRVRIAIAQNYVRAGDLHSAKHEADLLAQMMLSDGQAYNECWLSYLLGRIAYEWNDLAAAAAHFRNGSQAHGGNFMSAIECFLGLALTAETRGDWEAAGQAVQQALGMAKALGSEDLVTLVLSCRTHILLIRGERALGFANFAASTRQDPAILSMPIEIPRITEARRLLAGGRPAELKEAERMMEEVAEFLAWSHAQISASGSVSSPGFDSARAAISATGRWKHSRARSSSPRPAA